MIHQVKLREYFFKEKIAGRKAWELRLNDRNYQIGDYLGLNEIDDDGKDWLEIASKMVEQNNDGVKFAPLSNIAGADIKFDKGYGTIKINVPADVADDLTNGSRKYVGGFLLLDRETYEQLKGGGE